MLAGNCFFTTTLLAALRDCAMFKLNANASVATRPQRKGSLLMLKLQLVTLRKTSITVLCSIWKNKTKCHNTHRQLLVSDVVGKFCEVSVFSHASVFRIDKSPIVPVLFAQTVTLTVLSVLIGRSTLRLLATTDIGTSWLAVHASRSDSPLLTTVSQLKLELRWPSLLRCNFPCDCFVSIQTGLKRKSDNMQNKTLAGGNGCSRVASQRVSCYS